MEEGHGTNMGRRRHFSRGGGGAGCAAIAAVLVLNALAANVSAFVPPLSSSVRGLHRPLRPPSAETAVRAPSRRHCSSGRGSRRKSWANGASAGGRGGSAGITMNGGGGVGHRIETKDGGVSTLTVTVGGRELSFETGKVGRQASGAVMARDGETVVYSTACADRKTTSSDFSPLRVDYMERFSAAGMTSGGYNKRDGRASDKETLVSRLMDRPLRPAMHPGWFHETQLLSWVLSYDTVHPPVPLAITAASAALALSNVPLVRAIAGVTVGMDSEGELVINPEMAVAAMSPLNLTIAGTADGVLMIEGESDFVGEEEMMRAIEVGHAAVRDLCLGIEEWSEVAGKEKKTDTLRFPPEGLDEVMRRDFQDKVDAALFESGDGKDDQSSAMRGLSELTREALAVDEGEEPGDGRFSQYDVNVALKKLYSNRLRTVVKETGKRCDGRKTDEVRPISIETGLLPRTHGSCIFTRGDTQAIATVTLGGSGSSQKTDGITGTIMKHFYLQYTFPPSCVGETGRIGGPGRREVGHGALAEKALSYTVPSVNDFPYTVRVESLITESCGSSSMASVCGGSLAMMDAGIPVSSPIAGVAMGLLLDEGGGSGEDAVVLTDILGLEDALGTMDFKVAGNEKGITTFQLDIKCAGLTTALLGRALTQAKEGRLHILKEMNKALPGGPKQQVSPFVPTATVIAVDPDQIGKIIGPGGKIIRQIIDDFSLDNMDVEEDGRVMISSFNSTNAASAVKYIEEMLKDATLRGGGRAGGPGGRPGRSGIPSDFNATAIIGNTYRNCEVVSIQPFGCFVEFAPGLEGLVHVSELDVNRVVTAEGFLANKPVIDVKVVGLNDKGKVRLSRKAVLMDDRGAGGGGGGGGGGANSRPPRRVPNGARTGLVANGGSLGVVKRAADPPGAPKKAEGGEEKAAVPLAAAVAEGPAGGITDGDKPEGGG